MMHHADQQGCTIFREAGDLEHDGKGQSFLGTHENDSLPSAPADVQQTGTPEGED